MVAAAPAVAEAVCCEYALDANPESTNTSVKILIVVFIVLIFLFFIILFLNFVSLF